jgi:gluconolactonase
MQDISARTIHQALFGFATAAIPAFAQYSASFQSQAHHIQSTSAVLPIPFTSRNYSQPWILDESTSESSPFHIFDPRAQRLVNNESNVLLLVENKEDYAFAHEAPVYFADTDQLYFCSDAGGEQGRSNSTTNNVVFQLTLQDVITRAQAGISAFEEDVHVVEINSDSVQMTNGATPYQDQLLLANSGRTAEYSPTLAIIDRHDPSRVITLLNNVAGKQFNGINDVKVNFQTGSIYFTDTSYGQSQHFRPTVDLPKATWRFDPRTGRVSMLDASVITPNGLALSKDGKTLYITETASNPGGDLPVDASIPSVM